MIIISGGSSNFLNDFENADNKNPIVVNSCGYQKFFSKNYEISRQSGRVDFQIIYIIKGKCYVNYDGETHEIPEGNIIVYSPGQPQYYEYHYKDLTEVYWIHFTGSAIHQYLKALGLLDKQVYYISVDSEYIIIYKKIINELQLKNPGYELVCSANLLELFTLFSRTQPSLKAGKSLIKDDAINQVVIEMHSKYNQKFYVNDFAMMCNLSLYRFIHKFKDATGYTPVQYITKIRIDEAKFMLSNSSLSITEIASIVGYVNSLYFSRIFKKVTGYSPSIYKSNITSQSYAADLI